MPVEKPVSVSVAHRKIIKAEKDALKRIEDREASALKILTTATAEALKVTVANNANTGNSLDSSMLTTLVERVGNLDLKFTEKFQEVRIDIKEIKDGLAGRMEKLELYVYEKLEPRVHKLENQVARFWITIALYTLAVGSMIYLILNHISK